MTSFVLEVPSGAWADLVDRRTLLVLSGPIYAVGFAAWIVWPTYPGFAFGFVLWGLSSALMSGTFEALVYDELAERDATDVYAGLLGLANAAATAASVVAIAVAAPLLAWGGFAAVGWVSVGVAAVHGTLAMLLPTARRSASADGTREDPADTSSATPFVTRYVGTLRAGLGEATSRPGVRHLVGITAVLYGLTAFDEYFPAVALEAGAPTAHVPALLALTVAGQLVGSALAGRTARLSPTAMATLIAAAGALLAAGALAHHPAGFVTIAIGYGLIESAVIASDAKLQDGISGQARATVTSVSGLSSEIVAVAIFGVVAAGSSWLSVSALLAVVSVPTLAVAAAVRRWWPSPVDLCSPSNRTLRINSEVGGAK